MISGAVGHLWQSTLFAGAAGLMALALRNHRAQIRYWIWFLASVKFLVPFAVLVRMGALAPGRVADAPAQGWVSAVEGIGRPLMTLPAAARLAMPVDAAGHDYLGAVALGLWACGCGAVAGCWLRRWMRVRALRRSATPASMPAGVNCAVPAMWARGVVEPGIFGIVRPVLLLPEGIGERLDGAQLRAILSHEMCHVRRRDNLTAAIHMASQAIFWFHPLVWWLGARLVEERERACDEEVVRLGSEPRVYAQAILDVCKLYVESPLACLCGVTGSNLKKRIEAIMTNRVAARLNIAQKAGLAVAATAALTMPVLVGVLQAPAMRAQSTAAPRRRFEVASVKRCTAQEMPVPRGSGGRGAGGGGGSLGDPGIFRTGCMPVRMLIQMAYIQFADGSGLPVSELKKQPLQGAPDWIDADRYVIDARPESPQTRAMMAGPMLQTLLEERFRLKMHRESKETAVYALVTGKGGSKLQATKEGGCTPGNPQGPPLPVVPGQPLPCGYVDGGPDSVDAVGVPIASLCQILSSQLPRKAVDRTGLSGLFNYHLDFGVGPPGTAPGEDDPTFPDRLSMMTAALAKLGLKLEASKGMAEFLVIDHVERPTEN